MLDENISDSCSFLDVFQFSIFFSNFVVSLTFNHWNRIVIKLCWGMCQVKLWCDCPFWPDDGMCRLRDCSVCECPETEFPESFKKPFIRGLSSDDLACQEGKPEAAVDRTLDSQAFRGWTETDNPWTHDDETDNGQSFVCIQAQPHI